MITEEELAYALEEQRATGNRLGEILVARGGDLAPRVGQRARGPVGKPAEAAPARAGAWQRAPARGQRRALAAGPLGAAETERVDALEARLAELEERDGSALRDELSARLDTLAAALATAEAELHETLAGVDEARAEGAAASASLPARCPRWPPRLRACDAVRSSSKVGPTRTCGRG